MDLPSPPALVTAAVILPKLTLNDLAKLAREIAQNIRDLPDTLALFKLDEAQYAVLLANPFFKRALEGSILEWEAAGNTVQRLALGSAAILEDSLPHLGARMTDDKEPLPAAVETAKLLAKLAGIGETNKTMASGEKFTITINLGDDKQLVYEHGSDQAPAAPSAPDKIRDVIEGDYHKTPLHELPEGEGSGPDIPTVTIKTGNTLPVEQLD